MIGRWVHDAGECQPDCTYCAEDRRGARPLTPEERAEILAGIHDGQARIPRPATSRPQLTNAESLARARKRLEDQQRRTP